MDEGDGPSKDHSAVQATEISAEEIDAILEAELGVYVHAASAPPPVPAFEEAVHIPHIPEPVAGPVSDYESGSLLEDVGARQLRKKAPSTSHAHPTTSGAERGPLPLAHLEMGAIQAKVTTQFGRLFFGRIIHCKLPRRKLNVFRR